MTKLLLDSLSAWWPEALISGWALVLLLMGAWPSRSHETPRVPHPRLPAIALFALLGAGAALWNAPVPPAAEVFFGLIILDPFGFAIRWLVLGTLVLVVLLMWGSRDGVCTGESLGLALLLGVGLMLMAEANHLLMAYVAVELVSLSSYLLVGSPRDARSSEAALKYLLIGALSSALMVFGMSLLFGATGELALPALSRSLEMVRGPAVETILVAVLLMVAGLAFKVSMVPFHLWTPDAYEGAPAAVAALLSVGPKAAGLALLLRMVEALSPAWPALEPSMLGLTAVTMTLGNVVALLQTNVKRLFAYSTIAQVGYLLIGLCMGGPSGTAGLLVYLIAYLFMNLGAFAAIIAIVNETGSESLDAFRGLSRRAPGLALACALFLLSLAGIPPLLGFLGKFLVFGAAVSHHAVWLAAVGAINSAIALYYYVNMIRLMYLAEPQDARPIRPPAALRWALGLCALATVGFGLFPSAVLTFVSTHVNVNLL